MTLASPARRAPDPELLHDVARRVRPTVLARERVLSVPGSLGEVLPGAGLRRGAVFELRGATGTGVTSVTLELAAACTRTGEWAAFVDPAGTLGGVAAAEAGVALERFAVVRDVSRERWGAVVAALVDGFSLVVAEIPVRCPLGDARRLVARARDRDTVLVALGDWPVEAACRLQVTSGSWSGLEAGSGLLATREVRVGVQAPEGVREAVLAG